MSDTRAVRPMNSFAIKSALLVMLLSVSNPWVSATAADFRVGSLIVASPWSRPTPPGTQVGVAYFTLTNSGAKSDQLLTLESVAAASVEIHESRSSHGVVEMHQVTSLECPPGQTVKIQPGGLHVMLLGLTRPLAPGSSFPLTLHFRDAGAVTVQVAVAQRE